MNFKCKIKESLMKILIRITFLIPLILFGQQLWPGTTDPSKNRHLVRELGTQNLHCVFLGQNDEVYYSFSSDGGYKWIGPELVFAGPADTPALCLVNLIVGVSFPCITFHFVDPEIGDCLGYRYRSPSGWLGFDFTASPNHLLQPTISSRDDTVYIAYAVWFWNQPEKNRRLASSNKKVFRLKYNIKGDIVDYVRFRYDETEPIQEVYPLDGQASENPSITVDGNLNLHVCWNHAANAGDLDVWYRKRELINDAFYWIPPLDQPPWRVYSSPSIPSDQAFIESYGDSIFIVWSEEETPGSRNSREIYEAKDRITLGKLPIWLFHRPLPTPNTASELPCKAWREFIVWAEEKSAPFINFDIAYWSPTWGSGFIYESDAVSYSPSAAIRNPPESFWDELYTLWSENPDQPNEIVCFDHRVFGKGRTEPLIYYGVQCGKKTPSPYCLKRTGFITYPNYSIDFSYDTLKYTLPFLNSYHKISYKLFSLIYFEGTEEHSEKIFIDDLYLGTYKFRPNRLETLCVSIPYSAYRDDRKVVLTILNESGKFASRALMKLYQIERPIGGKNEEQEKCLSKISDQLQLHVYTDSKYEKAQISYYLPGNSYSICKVYDIMGRCLKTLTQNTRAKGRHTFVMNIGNLSNGIYFIRLEYGKVSISKKMVIMR